MCAPDTIGDFLASALPEVHTWATQPSVENLVWLPGCPAIYLLVDATGAPIQLATTQSLRRLLVSRLTDPRRLRPGRADLAEIARGVRWRPLCTAFEGRWWYYCLTREMYPQEYRRLISFGPAYFLHVDWDQPIPEPRVTERIWCLHGHFVGPWRSHKACQEALEGLWDLFDLCRYPEQVRKTPRGIRCTYAEMGRCDAPCDGSVPLAAYVSRCRAAWRFATGGVDDWLAAAAERMKQAADERKYELAGLIKQQLEFARMWQTQWAARLRPAEALNYLLGLPVTRRRAWKLFLFRGGHLADGPIVPGRRIGPDAIGWLRQQLAQTVENLPPTLRMEQTWLLCHLLFSRECGSALLVPLPTLEIPADLEQTLPQRATAARERRRRHTAPRGPEAPKRGPTGSQPVD